MDGGDNLNGEKPSSDEKLEPDRSINDSTRVNVSSLMDAGLKSDGVAVHIVSSSSASMSQISRVDPFQVKPMPTQGDSLGHCGADSALFLDIP